MTNASDLIKNDIIIDPDGNPATISRIRMIDHTRLRIDTDMGVHIFDQNDKVTLAP